MFFIMQKLLAFIVAKRHWFLLIICEIVAFAVIYRNNAYQRNLILSSANAVTGRIMAVSGSVLSYFDLQNMNRELIEQNSRLEMEVIRLQEQLGHITVEKTSFNRVFLKDTVLSDSLIKRTYTYRYISAGVVNSSVNLLHNYITINKGSADGIRPDMGVVSPRGIAGIVTTVDDRFSVVMSLLNIKSRVSCKIQHTHFSGSLSWKGDDVKYAYLEQIAAHAPFQAGDTIVTSGYSDVFPPGIMVGVIESFSKQNDDNFYSLKVNLSTDFQSVNALYAIDNQLQDQLKKIEREARKND
jgi:rod shape-determining protein MreC